MKHQDVNSAQLSVGQTTCWMVFVLGIFYAIITSIGLLSLESPQDPIGNPYFTIMEILSILIALLMAIGMVAVHYRAASVDKFFSLTALVLMFITTGITSSVHFLILAVSHSSEATQLPYFSFFFSFKWPSVVYALDVLAWDWFFALSMLFAAPVFKSEKNLSTLLIICGVLSLIGLIGVPLQNMQIRNIGIIGYAVVGPVAFLFIGKSLGRARKEQV